MLEPLLLSIANICVGLCAGVIVFQSFIVAPTLFTTFEEDQAGRFLRAVFPRFFRLNLALSATACIALASHGWVTEWSTPTIGGAGITAAMAGAMFACDRMIPAINAARDAGEQAAPRFERLHKGTVGLTVLVLFGALAILISVATSAPAGQGL